MIAQIKLHIRWTFRCYQHRQNKAHLREGDFLSTLQQFYYEQRITQSGSTVKKLSFLVNLYFMNAKRPDRRLIVATYRVWAISRVSVILLYSPDWRLIVPQKAKKPLRETMASLLNSIHSHTLSCS
jgi:hypothetical protein